MKLVPVMWLLISCCCIWCSIYGREHSTILMPESPTLKDLCPGDRIVIICNASGTQLNWVFAQKMLIFTYTSGDKHVINATFPVNTVLPNEVKLSLLHFSLMPRYLTSSFEYQILDNFTEDTVTCNDENIQLMKNCSLFMDNFYIHNFTDLWNASSFLLIWRSDISRTLKYYINEVSVNENVSYISIPVTQHYIELLLEHEVNYSIIIKLDSYDNDMLIAIVNMTLQRCGNSNILIRAKILNNNTVTMKSFLCNGMIIMLSENPMKCLMNDNKSIPSSAYSIQDATSTDTLEVFPVSSNVSLILTLGGSLAAVFIICTLAIIISVIVILKKKKGKTERIDHSSQNEEEYDHFKFCLASKTAMEGDNLYSSLHAETNWKITTDEVEEYNTIHQPPCVKITSKRDEYDYTSIRYNDSKMMTPKNNQKEERKYAVLECFAAKTNQSDLDHVSQGETFDKKYEVTEGASENVSTIDHNEPPPVPPQYF